jgi:alpha-glucosidase
VTNFCHFCCCRSTFHCRYNATVSGPSGNITVNGSLTYGAGVHTLENNLSRDDDAFLDAFSPRFTTSPSGPLYAIHNGEFFSTRLLTTTSYCFLSAALGDLSLQTIATNATHYGGRTELEVHNLFGHLMSRAANLAVRELHQGKRPFLISRSTFAGSGRWTGHWVRGIFLDD